MVVAKASRASSQNLVQDFRRILSRPFVIAEQERADQLALNAQRHQAAEPYIGDISVGAQKQVAALAAQALRPHGVMDGMEMFGQQRENRRLRKERETFGGHGGEHRGPFLNAEQRPRFGLRTGHDNLQSRVSGLFEAALSRNDRAKIGQSLGCDDRWS